MKSQNRCPLLTLIPLNKTKTEKPKPLVFIFIDPLPFLLLLKRKKSLLLVGEKEEEKENKSHMWLVRSRNIYGFIFFTVIGYKSIGERK